MTKMMMTVAFLQALFINKKLFMLITFPVFYRGELDAFQNKVQLIGSDWKRVLVKVKLRKFKGAFFQAAVHNRKSILLPHQEFQMRAGPVDENKPISAHYTAAQLVLDDAAQGIEAFAHIRFLPVQVVAALVR